MFDEIQPNFLMRSGAKVRGRVLRPEDACQKRFSGFFNWIPKVQKCVNLVDLVKSFQTSIYYQYLLTNIGVDTAENGPLKVCQKVSKSQKQIRNTLEKTQAERHQDSDARGHQRAHGQRRKRRKLLFMEVVIFHESASACERVSAVLPDETRSRDRIPRPLGYMLVF